MGGFISGCVRWGEVMTVFITVVGAVVGRVLAFVLLALLCLPLRTRRGMCAMSGVPGMRLRGGFRCMYGPTNVLSRTTYSDVSHVLCGLRRAANVRAMITMMPSVNSRSYFRFTRRLLGG